MNLRRISQLTKAIEKAISRTDSTLDYDRTVEAITLLANSIAEYEGETEDWLYLNEFGYTPDSILAGAYLHFSEWHDGQSSDSYAALCACGRIFSPGYTNGPAYREPDSCEEMIYNDLNDMAEALQKL